ncbi:hypothetical protein FN846DRAFT_236583 [Sphaerosporella brunnea]|uniref:Tim44-like domain-containing protein n=1 Tax=Sphaerosporella brunnea TaxID=1250544 RepID=A0A5J5FBU8_9PEZI|nr:hypothetical protein FN846DRAFT_236583 [Sphaerosporella brunnea]
MHLSRSIYRLVAEPHLRHGFFSIHLSFERRPLTMLPLRAAAVTRPIARSPQLCNVRFKGSRGPPQPIIQMPAVKPQQSHRIAIQELGELPSDMGLLPDTFIMPTGKNLPSLIKSPTLRLQLESRRLEQRILDWRDKLIFRFMSKTKLQLFEPKKVAVSLHHDMYTAFAQGDVETLRLICGDGLFDSFKKRLMTRGRNRMAWKLHQYLEPPRIVSNKAHHYAGTNLSRRQAVVRIHSLQSLTKIAPNGQIVEGTDTPREVTEYVVVERKKVNGTESPWFVWGTTNETPL